jgi:hypothetical protein
MAVDLRTYLQRLQDLQVLEPAGIDFHLERYHNLSLGRADSAEDFGEMLIAAGAVTRWQHGRIIARRAGELRIAGLTLLDEVGNGDYLAIDAATRFQARLRSISGDGAQRYEQTRRRELASQISVLGGSPSYVTQLLIITHTQEEYLLEEYGQGVQLQQVVDQQGPLEIGRAVRVIREAARGLGQLTIFGHARNVTPGEVIVTGDTAKTSGMTLFDLRERSRPVIQFHRGACSRFTTWRLKLQSTMRG